MQSYEVTNCMAIENSKTNVQYKKKREERNIYIWERDNSKVIPKTKGAGQGQENDLGILK